MESGQRLTDLEEGDWGLAFDDWAVGQAAAGNGHLDFDFDEAALVKYLGRPILPAGWTVAHEAAKRGLLPEGFSQWGLTDGSGRTVADIAVHVELPPAVGFEAREREEIEDLKRDWRNDPCWDIETTGGFEAHNVELRTYRLGVGGQMQLARDSRIKEFARTTLGMPDNPVLAEYILKLHDRISELEEKIELLGEIVCEENTARKSHGPQL